MTEDPVALIEGHIEKGVILFNEGRQLDDNIVDIRKWEKKAEGWSRELEELVQRYSPRDLHHVRTVWTVPLEPMKALAPISVRCLAKPS